jgi:Domain of unknown function (DUF4331)
MSSHREAPEISKDPVCDNTDTYCFVSPDRPDTVTIITNYIPLEYPAGGPNFFEFGDDVLYRINVDNTGDGRPDIVYEFRFTTDIRNPDTFLYNTGVIDRVSSLNWNRPQRYSVTEVRGNRRRQLDRGLFCPPCNVGPRSTPNYAALANSAIYSIDDGIKVFAGQRLEGFYVDLGLFDLGVLRPFQDAHLISTPPVAGVDSTRAFNVHSIAIQVPIRRLTRDGRRPTDPMNREAVIGVWGSAHRQKGTFRDDGRKHDSGPWEQCSRLAMPLFNEVIVPMSRKDLWNSLGPDQDFRFARYVARPELARKANVLYPGAFPNLAAYTRERADLLAILLTGIPPLPAIPGFQNYTGPTQADEQRLNVAIPPSSNPNIMGILGGDLAGFPNGRRVFDDVVAAELQAVTGATIPLVDSSFTPDTVAKVVDDGVMPKGNVSYLDVFPYLDHPVSGYDVVPPRDGTK